jgi:hypothetical protein
LVKEDDTDINFHYDAQYEKPFSVPVSIEWKGYLKVPYEGDYRFSLACDDGATLILDDVQLIDNGGTHMVSGMTSTVKLAEGYHRLVLRYFDVGGGAIMDFGWANPPEAKTALDSDALFH